jgi:ferredoxin
MHSSLERSLAEQLLTAMDRRDVLEFTVQRLRDWMAEYPDDKFSGSHWLAELDRIIALAKVRHEPQPQTLMCPECGRCLDVCPKDDLCRVAMDMIFDPGNG